MSLYDQLMVTLASVFSILAWLIYTPAPWYKSWTGRVLWTLLTSITFITWIVTLSTWFDDFALREVLRHFTYTLVLANSILVLVSIVTAMNTGRKNSARRNHPAGSRRVPEDF